MKPTKYFKCCQYSHIMKSCTSEVDRSICCIKYGAEGHKAESCTERPYYVFCKDYVDKETNHVPGSRGCSVYEKSPSPKMALKFLQITLNHCEAALDQLTQTVREKK